MDPVLFLSLLTNLYPHMYNRRVEKIPIGVCGGTIMKKLMEKLERLLELGGTKKDIALLVISSVALIVSLTGIQLPFNAALSGW